MAIDRNGLRFLLLARAGGVSFTSTLTLGRLSVYVDRAGLQQCFADFGDPVTGAEGAHLLSTPGGYADAVLTRLGAERVDSLDADTYQDATIRFDLNRPLPSSLRRQASAVLDFGTLEHVFEAATALRNCMEMVAPGGHLLICSPANNSFGHGFYQFSPEFYFRALTEQNGFVLERALLCTERHDAPWYTLLDPAEAGRRAEAPPHSGPLTMLVVARRVNGYPALATAPQQSDYAAAWQKAERRGAHSNLRQYLPTGVKTAIRNGVAAVNPPPQTVREVRPEALARGLS